MRSVRILCFFALASIVGFGASCNCGDPVAVDNDAGVEPPGPPDDAGVEPDAGIPPGALAMSCLPCTDDTQCVPGARCVDIAGTLACAARCNLQMPECPTDFTCTEVGMGSPVCIPNDNVCCVDEDNDGAGQGVHCTNSDCDDGDPAIFDGGVELCDTKDNDCNGAADDNIPAQTCGTGACEVTVPGCVDGEVPMCTPGAPGTESCNGLDDDCNGNVDDGLMDLACGFGVCANQVPACVQGVMQTCEPLDAGTLEVCNGLDDDCNAAIDENLGSTTCGLGVCENTVANCLNGLVQNCEPLDAGTAELCNALDDDCNGQTDENLGTTTCGQGVCENTVDNCVGGATQTCAPLDAGTAETCNSVDDDCNGTVDDGLGQTSCGVGACASTVDNCVGGQVQSCVPGNPTVEVCNGIDDDCNASTDDGLGSTSCGVGACAVTVDNCLGGQPQLCVPGNPTAETCNSVDDDCNGQTDEGLGSTTCGVGACVATVQNCVGGQTQSCVPGTPGTEVCNGIDDNCDGATDENLGSTTCGTGACQVTVANCAGGQSQTCTPGTPSAELCNGIDDNCDGQVDEGLGTISCGVGACAMTVPACVNGQSNVCTPGTGTAETCNNVDDNCDGQVDEGDPQGGGLCSTGQPGICFPGTQHCVSGAIQCVQDNQPSTESCNLQDDDCDGAVDDGNPGGGVNCNTGKQGVCSAGKTQCTNGSVTCAQNVQATTEVCNGLDDDCDGTVDEGNPGGGSSCATGQPGVCFAGTTACQGGAVACIANTSPSTDVCDGLDNDCDGAVDENNPGGGVSCSTGQSGICSAGTTACTGGSLVCNRNQNPATDTCNGLDDDCDGSVDEGNPGGGVSCSTGQSGICSAGTTACTGGAVVCNRNQNPSAEVCDGIDSDCDGAVDEGNPGGGGACNTGLPGRCAAGVVVCSSGSLTCAQTNQPISETCNGIDDDCDGQVDEGNPSGGLACNTGLQGICSAGTTACVNGAVACQQNNQPQAEICNGVDEDCNGVADNGNPGGGANCSTGQPGICSAGTTACQSGALICNQNLSPTAEVCDGLDNDCNGVTDNGNPGGNASCSTGQQGICAAGTTACTSGALVCNRNQNPTTETCNGLDDDCNGQTDLNAYVTDGNPNTCATATNKAINVAPGAFTDVTGYVDPNGNDFFVVNFTSVPGAGQFYHPKITLQSNPNDEFRILVYPGTSCTSAMCAIPLTTFERTYPYNPNNCLSFGNCSDAVPRQATFTVEVRRTAGPPTTCTQYVVRASN